MAGQMRLSPILKRTQRSLKKENRTMIACCGLDCSKCETYLATREDNDAKRAEVDKKMVYAI